MPLHVKLPQLLAMSINKVVTHILFSGVILFVCNF